MMIHTDERPIQCSICHMRFRTNSNYNKHAKTHLKKSCNNISKVGGIRIIPDVELSVQQLSLPGDGPVQLDLSGVPVLTPLTVQPVHLGQTEHITTGLLSQGVHIPTSSFLV